MLDWAALVVVNLLIFSIGYILSKYLLHIVCIYSTRLNEHKVPSIV